MCSLKNENAIRNVTLSRRGRCSSWDEVTHTDRKWAVMSLFVCLSFSFFAENKRGFFFRNPWWSPSVAYIFLIIQIYSVKLSSAISTSQLTIFSVPMLWLLTWYKAEMMFYSRYRKHHWELNCFSFFLIIVDLVQMKEGRLAARESKVLCYLWDAHDMDRGSFNFSLIAICQLSNPGKRTLWESVSFIKDRISR